MQVEQSLEFPSVCGVHYIEHFGQRKVSNSRMATLYFDKAIEQYALLGTYVLLFLQLYAKQVFILVFIRKAIRTQECEALLTYRKAKQVQKYLNCDSYLAE